jgi:predicted dithiol-disulfide oxidoreductase (DUF899 family)
VPTDFVDDDAGYLAWLRKHPAGFVVNCYRKPTPDYLKLHLASCWKITTLTARGTTWTKDYRKVCADAVAELEHWAAWNVGGEVSCCGICRP